MLLFLFLLSTCFRGYDFWITNSKCVSAYLSIGAKSHKIVINWSLNCTKDTRPDHLRFYVDPYTKIHFDLDKDKNKGFRDTGIRWNYDSYPGYWYYFPLNPFRDPSVCYPYRIKLFRRGVEVFDQCLFIHPNWMSRFNDSTKLRIGEIFVPGTYGSLAPKNENQNFRIWGQLVFGMRYFDINVANTKLTPSKIVQELSVIDAFLQRSKKEIVILDFNNFGSYNEADHEKLVDNILNTNFSRFLAVPQISNHPKGPLLRILWETNMRIIINYRHKETVRKHNNILWNDIFIKDGKKKTVKGLKDYIIQVAKLPYKEKMSAIFAVLYSDQETNEQLADKLNPHLSDWYFDNRVIRHINILIVEFFESSRLHIDCFRINEEKVI